MTKETFSLSEAEELQLAGWKVKSITGNPKVYVMEKAEDKPEIKETKSKEKGKV